MSGLLANINAFRDGKHIILDIRHYNPHLHITRAKTSSTSSALSGNNNRSSLGGRFRTIFRTLTCDVTGLLASVAHLIFVSVSAVTANMTKLTALVTLLALSAIL
jgi:hypothetical protein